MNRVVVITGGTRGLGYEIAKKFLIDRDKVIIAGRDVECGKVAEKELSHYGECHYIAVDVKIEAECKRLVDQVVKHFSTIHVLINNAAYIATRESEEHLDAIMDANIKKLENSLDVNVIGIFQMIKYSARVMADNKKGVIINIGSVADRFAISEVTEYCISKAAVVMLTKCSALQLSAYGIRCICVSPGELNNPSADYIRPYYLTGKLNKQRAANAVFAVADDSFECINGSELLIDDGYNAFKGDKLYGSYLFLGYRFRNKLKDITEQYKSILLFTTVNINLIWMIMDIIKEYTTNFSVFTNKENIFKLDNYMDLKRIFAYEGTGPMKGTMIKEEIEAVKKIANPDCILVPCRSSDGIDYENVREVAGILKVDTYWLNVETGSIDKG